MLSLHLFAVRGDLGALNLYAGARGVFDHGSEELATVFAAHAAIALAGAQEEAHMRVALDNRDVIGQAKGILMERHKLTPDQAFVLLARASQENNVKIRDLAVLIATTGEFD